MNIQDVFYHGVRQQIRRVLTTMGPEKVDLGLTAFEDGSHDWANCFFARAYPELDLKHYAENQLCKALGLKTYIPIRMVYCTFDGAGAVMTSEQLKKFIEDIRDDMRPEGVMDVLRSLDFSKAEETEAGVPTCR